MYIQSFKTNFHDQFPY